jgi:ribonuclease HI
MNFVKLSDEFIKSLDDRIIFHLNSSAGVQGNLKKERYYGEKKEGLLGLISLKDVQTSAFCTSLLDRAINFDNSYPKNILIENKRICEELQFRDSTKELIDILNNLGLESIGWDDPIELRSYRAPISEIDKKNNMLMIQKYIKTTHITYEYDDYLLLGTDGAKNEDGTGCGLGFGDKEMFDYSRRASFAETVLGAELESIAMTIVSVPEETNIMIVTDSLKAIKLINLNYFTNKQMQSTEEYPIIELIQYLSMQRKGKIIIEWVPAHQKDKSREGKREKIEKRNKEIDDRYGEGTHKLFEKVNISADRVAKYGICAPRFQDAINEIPRGFPQICVKKPGNFLPRGGNVKGLIKSILAEKNLHEFLKVVKIIDNKEAIKLSQILEPLKRELFLFVFKLRAGNLNLGIHKDRITPKNSDIAYHSFMSIRNPSSFCEFGSCKNQILNDHHLFNQCQHNPIKESRDNMMDNIRIALSQDEDIIAKKLQDKANKFPVWFDSKENYLTYQYNIETWEMEPSNEKLPEEFIIEKQVEEIAEYIAPQAPSWTERMSKFNIPNTNQNNQPSKKKTKEKPKPQDIIIKDNYTKDELDKMKVATLKVILKEWKLKVSGRKEFLINRILNKINKRNQEQLEPQIEIEPKPKSNKLEKIKINDNPDNNVPRIHYHHENTTKRIEIEIKQVNLMIARRTTQKNINSRNKSLNRLANGRITNHITKDSINTKQITRGIVNNKLIEKIETEFNIKDKNIIKRLAMKINNLYLIGCKNMFDIYRKENVILRKNEGVDITKYLPIVINKFKKSKVDKNHNFNPGIT